jgi:protein gp37
MDHRFERVAWGPSGTRVLTSDANWNKPIVWNKNASITGKRTRVFCASLADVFEDWTGPIHDHKGNELRISKDGRITDCIDWTHKLTMTDVRRRLFELIDVTPNLDWMLLTKRPENVLRFWKCKGCDSTFENEVGCSVDKNNVPVRKNVWLGTSVENQEYADKRIPELLKCRDLAPVLFLSCEPLLGPVNFERIPIQGFNLPHLDVLRQGCWLRGPYGFVNSHNAPSIDWVIAGGESGPEARPSHPDWFRSLRDHCHAANVPFHFKQWGEWHPKCSTNYATGPGTYRYGKVEGLSMLRNGEICLRNSKENPADKAENVNPFWTSQSQQPNSGYQWMHRIGVKESGRLLDKQLHDAFPEVLS